MDCSWDNKIIYHLFLIIHILCSFVSGEKKSDPIIQDGIIDLTNWDLRKDGPIRLTGRWEFYLNQLLTPQDFLNKQPEPQFIHVPRSYPEYNHKNKTSKPLCSTYRLMITNIASGEYALSLSKLLTFGIWIDGEMYSDYSGDQSAKKSFKDFIVFKPARDSVEIVIQIGNYNYYRNSGLVFSPKIGDSSLMFRERYLSLAIQAMLLGIILLAAFSNFLFYFTKKKPLEFIYFAIFCVLMGLRLSLSENQLFLIFFSSIDFTLYYRLFVLVTFLLMPVYLLFFNESYKVYTNKLVFMTFLYSGICFVILSCVLDLKYFLLSNTILALYQFTVIGLAVHVLFCLYKAICQKSQKAVAEGLSFLFFFSTVLIDWIIDIREIDFQYVMPIGITAYITFQLFIMSNALSKSIEGLNESLAKLNNLKDEFLAKTTHELRTPLNGIIGIAESLKNGIAGTVNDVMSDNLSIIITSGRRLSNMINDILDFSKLRNSDIVLQKKPVDLQSIVDGVVTVMQHVEGGRDVKVINSIGSTPVPSVLADENRLQQILYNLIGNAIKFTIEGAVTISACEREGFVEVSVTDTGMGIDIKKTDLIFESFEQINYNGQLYGSGTGLGLPITRKLIELHGGTISVESQLNKGSRFYFTLPVSREKCRADNIEGMSKIMESFDVLGSSNGIEKKSLVLSEDINSDFEVLAVDDEMVNLQVLKNFLHLEHIQVMVTNSGTSALSILKRRKPDLVILDVMMPKINGYEVCRQMRETYSPSELPIIMVTAKNRISDLVQGFNSGANDYITKPFLKEELIVRVRSQLQLKKAYQILLENVNLKKEIESRRNTEIELRLTHRRLSEILNVIDEALVAVNESGEICFCNVAAENCLGYIAEDLLGKNFREILVDRDSRYVIRLEKDINMDIVKTKRYPQIRIQPGIGNPVIFDILLTKLETEDEQISALILRSLDGVYVKEKNSEISSDAERIISVLNENNARILRFEEFLTSLNHIDGKPKTLDLLQNVDLSLEKLSHHDGNKKNKHQLAIEIMELSLYYWQECTNSGKVELAKASGLWSVYTNLDGWTRTQTLDKYLCREKFPELPNWKKIIKTAEFVLAYSNKPSKNRSMLELNLNFLQKSFAR